MTLERDQIRRLAGRLVLGRVPGHTLEDAHRQALANGTMGGITLFKENAADLEQLAKLCGDIIEASHHNCVLAVDQEGGAVQRFDDVICPLPSPMALAAISGPQAENGVEKDALEQITRISASELKKLGINMLLAPTLDLQTNARNPIICTRAFSDDAKTTATLGGRVSAEIEAAGLVAVGKHFPGHGSTSEDSHLQLACVDKSESALMASDLVPFTELAKKLKAMLVGHIWLPQLVTDECPATLSEKIVNGMLRDKLGFDGLVVSDDMIMKAITQSYGLGEACVRALLAGVDLLLVCGTFEETMEAVDAITAAVEAGRISEDRLLQANKRIDKLFPSKPSYTNSGDKMALEAFAAEIDEHRTLSRALSASAIAILQEGPEDALAAVPQAAKITVVAPRHPRYPMDLAADLCLNLADEKQVYDLRYPLNPGVTDTESVVEEASGTVVFISYRSAINTGQSDLAQALARKGCKIIHIASDSPYDIEYLKGLEKSLSLASFDPSCQAMSALADVLTGVATARGKCPLKIAATA